MSISAEQHLIRNRMLVRRKHLSRAEILTGSKLIANSFDTDLGPWADANTVAMYWAINGELDLENLMYRLRARKKSIYLPKILAENTMEFRRFSGKSQLVSGAYNTLEPSDSAELITIEDIDVMFVPCVAADLRGNRIGMGGGYYDRFLATNQKSMLIGVAYEWQIVEKIPCQSWDVSLDYLLTPTTFHKCNR